MPNRAAVVAAAREWIGTPWRHQGRNERGIDCAGLVVKIAHKFGFSEFDATDYQRNTRGHDFMKYFRDNMDEIPVLAVDEGDVILFRDSMFPCHSAIVSRAHRELHIIHAYARRKRVLEEPLNQEWRSKWIAAFRYRGLEI